ncbi:MAG: hypothetical protein H6828_06300 [Planctomycetes bacterium]|nr:hypothetical protein [Planctomycetota bacterium]
MHATVVSLLALLALAPSATAQLDCAQGCTPGYWKTHPRSWDGDKDDFTQTIFTFLAFNDFMGVTPAQSGLANTVTLHDATQLGAGGLFALARHAAAGLASADALACYPYTVAQVRAIYRDGVDADPGPLNAEQAKNELAAANEIGCPLPDRISRFCFGDAGGCPCNNPSTSGGCANSSGEGARLDPVAGGASVFADDLVLQATNLPAGSFTILIAAEGHQAVPFSDGNLCVGGHQTKIVRYNAPLAAPPSGVLTWGPGLVALSQSNTIGLPSIVGIDAGESWFFQAYYRDAQGPCLTGSNTSNALAISFY